MSKTDKSREKIAYDFFKSKVGQTFSLSELGEITGWKEGTLKTYPSKKWYLFLKKEGNRQYFITEEINKFTFEDFVNLQSQKVLPAHSKEIIGQGLEKMKDFENKNGLEKFYLERIKIKNYHSLQNIDIQGLNSKEVYFLGENGDGKTLLLRAILLALKWNFIGFEDMKSILDKSLVHNDTVHFEVHSNTGQILNNTKTKSYVKNVFAYGVHRSQNDSFRFEKYGFLSLFDSNRILQNPEQWLKDLYLKEIEYKQNSELFEEPSLSVETVKKMFRDILEKNIQIEVSSKGVFFVERGTKTDFDILSEGYKTVIIWLVDLLYRLTESQPHAKLENKENGFTGIVLVDEVSLHLHPKWEYELPQKLRTWFPNIQFIFTTHSPITVLGASEDAVFFKLYKENGETKVMPYNELRVANMRVDQILTSPFFGLENARPKYLDEFMKIRKEILTKSNPTESDLIRLKKYEDHYGTLPTGETIDEIETKALITEMLNDLQNDQNK